MKKDLISLQLPSISPERAREGGGGRILPDALTINTYSPVSLHKASDCCLHDWILLIKSLSLSSLSSF